MLEAQSLRSLCRFLDYEKRVKNHQGLEELRQWVGRIVLDNGQVYGLEERALAFEIGACELLAEAWPVLEAVPSEGVILSMPVDRLLLYRHLLQAEAPPGRRAAFLQIFAKAYKKHAAWIRQRATAPPRPASARARGEPLLAQFLQQLERLEPLPAVLGGEASAAEPLRREVETCRAEIKTLKDELEYAEDRAGRAHQRLRDLDDELKQLKKRFREEKENGEKLRDERRLRIRSQRQSSEAQREMERLRREYLRLEARLQDMAARLAAQRGRPASQARMSIDLEPLRQMDAGQMLGNPAGDQELSRVRRRFAAVFHPDRVNDLPEWVGRLFEEVLGLVNQACDQKKK